MAKAADKAYLFERMPVKRAVLKQIVPTIIASGFRYRVKSH